MQTGRFINFKNSTIFYRISGSGKAVVLLHGFGEDGNIWNGLVNDLSLKYQVVVPDLPGSGRSEILKEENAEVSVSDYANVILAIIKKESIDACVVIGHSMGGYITLAIAEKYPQYLSGFGLFNSTAFADSDEKKSERLKSIAFLENHGAASFLKTSVPGLFAEKFKQDHADAIEKLIDSVNYFTSKALIQYNKAMISRPDRTIVLQTTALPVLFIIGEKDPAVPLEKALAQCHLPAVSDVHILPGAGHMGMLEAKELSLEKLQFYLDKF